MERIRSNFKTYLKRKSKKAYRYFSLLDKEMKAYLTGFLKIVVITLFEYTLTFYFIGHPNALLLGCLAAVANFNSIFWWNYHQLHRMYYSICNKSVVVL